MSGEEPGKSSGLIEEAVACAARGLPIFPVRPDTKRPWIRTGRDHAEHASNDVAQVREWFGGRYRDALIGMPTGVISKIVVVDADKKHDGEAVLARLEDRYGRLPRTVVVRTQSGGIHVYLRHPGVGVRIKSCVGGDSAPWPEHGVDVRGDGGIVIVPPSPGYVCEIATAPIEPLPTGWLDALTAPPRRTTAPVDIGALVYDESVDFDECFAALKALRRKYRSSTRDGDVERADLIDRVIESRALADVGARDSAVTRCGYLIGCTLADIGPNAAAALAMPSLVLMPSSDDGEDLAHWLGKFKDSYEAGARFRHEQHERERLLWLRWGTRRIS